MTISAQVEHRDGQRRVRFWISDEGHWREPRDLLEPPGLGLVLMRALAYHVLIRRGETSTDVMLLSTAVAA